MEEYLASLRTESEKILAKFKEVIASLRTSRPTPALVEDIRVEYYGSKLPLKQVAAISVVPPSVIRIQPWDKNALQPIEKAIAQSHLNVSPVVDGDGIRVVLPPLSEERRKDLAKVLSGEAEKSRIAFRASRDETRKMIIEAFSAKKISEDQKFKLHEMLQKEVDKFNEALDEVVERKEKEIMEQ